MMNTRTLLFLALRILIFPWFFFWFAGVFPRWLFHKNILSRPLRSVVHGGIYVVFFLPVTLILTIEILISVNEMVLGEQPSYQLMSDFSAGLAQRPFPLVGPPTPEIREVFRTKDKEEEYFIYLVKRYAPVIFQKVSHHPQWDIPIFLDFDGNANPRDNIYNEPRHRPHVAGIYGEVTAETEDSFYLTYSLYRAKDYDHPIREYLSSWTFHDNDNEGLHIRVEKSTMQVTDVETWFHNRFLTYNRTGQTTGTEPVHGTIHFENETHVLVYGQAQGHGVRLVQNTDETDLKKNVKILRYVGTRPDVLTRADHSVQMNCTYRLKNFDSWYQHALGPFDQDGDPKGKSLFSQTIPLGHHQDGRPILIGRFFAGINYWCGGWSRPKPMWSWDDGWDEIPNTFWHFFPSASFESHSGVKISHTYLYNRPIEKIFGKDVRKKMPYFHFEKMDREWIDLRGRGNELDRHLYWTALTRLVKHYVNYVFRALG